MFAVNRVINTSRKRQVFLLTALSLCLLWLIQTQKSHSTLNNDGALPFPAAPSLMDLIESINCSDPANYKNAIFHQELKYFLSEDSILERTANCDAYFEQIPTNAFHNVSMDEWKLRFGVAHSLHTQIGIFELYLALHYRPMDAHCIHIDQKAEPKVKEAIRALVRCYKHKFPGSTFLISKYEIPVFWGWDSVLEADLVCLRLLLQHDTRWHYFMNPAGTELPLVPFRQLRRDLLANNLSNVIGYEVDAPKHRQGHPYKMIRYDAGEFSLTSHRIWECDKELLPFKTHVLKASKNVVLNRTFAHFVIFHPVAIAYYNWIIDTFVPDEHFYSVLATLEVEQEGPDLYNVQQVITEKKMSDFGRICFRKSLWIYDEDGAGCHGDVIRWICHLAVEDLRQVRNSGCMYANKFDVNVDPSAIFCQVKHVMYLTLLETLQSQGLGPDDGADMKHLNDLPADEIQAAQLEKPPDGDVE